MKNMKIGDKLTRIPLIQGGMGVGISLGGLAGAVAAEGGVGLISTAQIGFREQDFDRDSLGANLRALKRNLTGPGPSRPRASSALTSWWPAGAMRPT